MQFVFLLPVRYSGLPMVNRFCSCPPQRWHGSRNAATNSNSKSWRRPLRSHPQKDWRLRLNAADEITARELAFNGGRYPQGDHWRLLRLALHEIDCLRADRDAEQVRANVMEHERDFEQQVVVPSAWDKIEAAEARVAVLEAALREMDGLLILARTAKPAMDGHHFIDAARARIRAALAGEGHEL